MKRYITAAILILAAFACAAGAADHNVNAGESIQAAINSATAGDTIHVPAGTYTENVVVNKALTLQGDGADVVTVEAASAAEHVFNVAADHVNITGFRVIGATHSQNAGIYLNDSNNSTIANNVVLGNCINIFIVHSNYNTLRDNIVSEGIYAGISMCHSSCYNTLINNTVNSNGGSGIYLYDLCNYTNIIHNTVNSNYGDGGGGIYIRKSCNYTNVIDNTVNSNTCSYGGIIVYIACSYTNILDNTVNSNTCSTLYCCGGITMYSSPNNMIIGNTAINNTLYSIRMQYANDNLICNNYFTNGAYTFSGSNIWNTTPTTGPNIVGGPEIGGNYWGDYAGTDGDGDGFGDEPYSISGCSNYDHLPLVIPLCGDITGDGTIDTVDLMLLLRRVVTGTPLASDCVCDIDGSGMINALDARMLMGYIHDPEGYLLNCGC